MIETLDGKIIQKKLDILCNLRQDSNASGDGIKQGKNR